jgi:hypothetical protein
MLYTYTAAYYSECPILLHPCFYSLNTPFFDDFIKQKKQIEISFNLLDVSICIIVIYTSFTNYFWQLYQIY